MFTSDVCHCWANNIAEKKHSGTNWVKRIVGVPNTRTIKVNVIHNNIFLLYWTRDHMICGALLTMIEILRLLTIMFVQCSG